MCARMKMKDSAVIATWVIVCLGLLVAPARAADRLWELMPDDAAVAVMLDQPHKDLPAALIRPILEATIRQPSLAKAVVEAFERLPGPTMVGGFVTKRSPRSGESERLDGFMVVEFKGRAFDFDAYVEKQLLPLLKAGMESEGRPAVEFDIDKKGDARRVAVKGKKESPFAYAIKDGRALLSTRQTDVQHWLAGQWPERPWMKQPGVKDMLGQLSKDAAVRVLVNPAPLIRLIPEPKPNSAEDLMLRILAPTDVRAGAGELIWDRRGIRLRLLAALAPECKGVAGVFAGAAGPSATMGIFPDDYFVVGRTAFSSGAAIVNGLYRVTDSFDPEISKEYREEAGEFQKDTGVDFTGDVLGGLTGEAVFGVRVDFLKKPPVAWAVVCPLKDEVRFADALGRLETHFGLTAKTVPMDELPIRLATEVGPFAWLVRDKRLIMAESPMTVAEVARNGKGDKFGGTPVRTALADCRKNLGEVDQVCVLADLEQLFAKAPMVGMAVGAKGTQLLRGTSVGVSVGTKEHVVECVAAWSRNRAADGEKEGEPKQDEAGAGESDGAMIQTVVEALTESIGNAEQQAKRTVSAANMRGIGQGLYIYASEHKDAFPDSLDVLIQDNNVSKMMFSNVYDGQSVDAIKSVDNDGFYLYRRGLTTNADPHEILLAERQVVNGEGANFLFVDGHVEFIAEPEASKLIEKIQGGEKEIRH